MKLSWEHATEYVDPDATDDTPPEPLPLERIKETKITYRGPKDGELVVPAPANTADIPVPGGQYTVDMRTITVDPLEPPSDATLPVVGTVKDPPVEGPKRPKPPKNVKIEDAIVIPDPGPDPLPPGTECTPAANATVLVTDKFPNGADAAWDWSKPWNWHRSETPQTVPGFARFFTAIGMDRSEIVHGSGNFELKVGRTRLFCLHFLAPKPFVPSWCTFNQWHCDSDKSGAPPGTAVWDARNPMTLMLVADKLWICALPSPRTWHSGNAAAVGTPVAYIPMVFGERLTFECLIRLAQPVDGNANAGADGLIQARFPGRDLFDMNGAKIASGVYEQKGPNFDCVDSAGTPIQDAAGGKIGLYGETGVAKELLVDAVDLWDVG